MKTTSQNLFTAISGERTIELTAEVRETIAFGVRETDSKIFSAADLWNIQRRQKPRIHRRYV